MSIVGYPVQHRSRNGGVADHLGPTLNRDLTCDERAAQTATILDNFKRVMALLDPKRLHSPVVEDQQLGIVESAHSTGVLRGSPRCAQIGQQPWQALVAHGSIVAAGL